MKLVDTNPTPKASDNRVATSVMMDKAAIKIRTDGLSAKNDRGCCKVVGLLATPQFSAARPLRAIMPLGRN